MNDMSAPFTNYPKSELACSLRADDRVESRVRFSLRSEFARRFDLGSIRLPCARILPSELCSLCHGGCHTTERGSQLVARRISYARNSLPPTH
jgi:hypothetical protein